MATPLYRYEEKADEKSDMFNVFDTENKLEIEYEYEVKDDKYYISLSNYCTIENFLEAMLKENDFCIKFTKGREVYYLSTLNIEHNLLIKTKVNLKDLHEGVRLKCLQLGSPGPGPLSPSLEPLSPRSQSPPPSGPLSPGLSPRPQSLFVFPQSPQSPLGLPLSGLEPLSPLNSPLSKSQNKTLYIFYLDNNDAIPPKFLKDATLIDHISDIPIQKDKLDLRQCGMVNEYLKRYLKIHTDEYLKKHTNNQIIIILKSKIAITGRNNGKENVTMICSNLSPTDYTELSSISLDHSTYNYKTTLTDFTKFINYMCPDQLFSKSDNVPSFKKKKVHEPEPDLKYIYIYYTDSDFNIEEYLQQLQVELTITDSTRIENKEKEYIADNPINIKLDYIDPKQCSVILTKYNEQKAYERYSFIITLASFNNYDPNKAETAIVQGWFSSPKKYYTIITTKKPRLFTFEIPLQNFLSFLEAKCPSTKNPSDLTTPPKVVLPHPVVGISAIPNTSISPSLLTTPHKVVLPPPVVEISAIPPNTFISPSPPPLSLVADESEQKVEDLSTIVAYIFKTNIKIKKEKKDDTNFYIINNESDTITTENCIQIKTYLKFAHKNIRINLLFKNKSLIFTNMLGMLNNLYGKPEKTNFKDLWDLFETKCPSSHFKSKKKSFFKVKNKIRNKLIVQR